MITIKKHSKKQSGWYFPLCKSHCELTFSFNESFIYEGKNQSDVHKVFGIGIFAIPHSFKTGKHKKWWELHKWISLRLGARWSKKFNCVELTDYSYINGVGERDTTNNKILRVGLHQRIYARIEVTKHGLNLFLKNKSTLETLDVFIPCKMPKFYLCMRLRAYMGNVYRTQDLTIETY